MKRNTGFNLVLSAVTATLLCLLATAPALGQGKSAPAKPTKSSATPASTSTAPVIAAQANAWTAFYAGKYEEAAKICADLLKATDVSTRLQAAHCVARCQWASGQPSAQATARRTFGQLAQEAKLPASKVRADLGKMIIQDAEAHPEGLPQAIAGLEIICRGRSAGTATVETLIELGHLYTRAARYDDAQKSYEQVAEILKDFIKLELTAAEIAPFQAEAKRLLGRLKFERDAGREPFEKAQVLQRTKKFPDAIAAYQCVVKDYSLTDFGQHSRFCIGECLRDEGKVSDAAAEWQRFIKAVPSGPWRGQAFVGLTDLDLEWSLDLKAAKARLLEAFEQLRPGLDGDRSGASWKAAASELYLRIGIVAYLEGRYPGAAQAFRESVSGETVAAKKSGPDPPTGTKAAAGKAPPVPAWIEPLVTAAEAGQPVLPADVGTPGPDDRPALALAVGRIYYLARRLDRAEFLFTRIMEPKTAAALLPPQRAYAQFGLGLVQEANQKADEAKAGYLASIKTCPNGSWNYDTLFHLATLIQREAERGYQDTKSKPADAGKAAATMAIAHSAYTTGRGQALPFWQELVKRYPQSPYAETAAYSVGLLCYEQGKWKDCLAALDDFTAKYPASLFKGEALWLQARTNFEQLLEPADAKRYYEALDAWLPTARAAKPILPAGWEVVGFVGHDESRDSAAKPTGQGRDETVHVVLSGALPVKREPGEKPQSYAISRYFDELESETAKSLGFLAFVDSRKDKAVKYYDRTEKLDQRLKWADPKNSMFSDRSRLKWGLEHGYLYAYPQELASYQDRQRFAVLMADFYYVTLRFDEAKAMAQRLLAGDAGRLSDSGRRYPLFLKAACTYWTGKLDEAFEQYMEVVSTVKSLKGGDVPTTVDRAAFAAGNISTNSGNRAIQTRGVDILRQLALSGRDVEYSYRARIQYALILANTGKKEEAAKILKSIPASAEGYRRIADEIVAGLAKPAQNQVPGANQSSKGDAK